MKATKIAWATGTFNPWWGCQRVDPACEHCYAEGFSHRLGLAVWGGAQSARRFFGDKHWNEPHQWNAEAAKSGQPFRVFCASMADWLEDRPDLVEARARLCRLIRETPALTWLMLTKRPENARSLLPPDWFAAGGWPVKAWFGYTAGDQAGQDKRWPHARLVPAPVVWCSYEPALEAIDFTAALTDAERKLAWIVVGGESGHGARPFDLAWARSTIAQCRTHGAMPFVKQAGERPILSGVNPDGARWTCGPGRGARPDLAAITGKGDDPAKWPEDLRVREWPVTL